MKKVVLELDEKLLEGELLLYKNGKIRSIGIFEMIPEYKQALKDIKELQDKVNDLQDKVKELRGED